MNLDLILHNLLSPNILFFFLGLAVVLVKSDLEIPHPLPKLFSLYLMLTIGFRGGVELRESGLTAEVVMAIGMGGLLAIVIPLYMFPLLKLKLDGYNAAALAATFGSVSTVSFATTMTFLHIVDVPYDGYMVASLAMMESPSIIVALILVKVFVENKEGAADAKIKGKTGGFGKVLHEAFFNGSVFLLLGALLIGFATDHEGAEAMKPFTHDIFKGMLCFFLLDMGITAGSRLGALRQNVGFLVPMAIIMPIISGSLGMTVAYLVGMKEGNALLLTVLCGSASSIAVPAAMRMAIPRSNPGLLTPTALGVTETFNQIAGIPLYYLVIHSLWN